MSSPENSKHGCQTCSAVYSQKSGLNRHESKAHAIVNEAACYLCPIADCNQRMVYRPRIVSHLRESHGEHLKDFVASLHFLKEEDFLSWKVAEEMNSSYRYIKFSGFKKYKAGKVVNYFCHRSGAYAPQGTKRKVKRQGSCRLGFKCPAFISTTYNDQGIFVEYLNYHPDHDPDIRHINLTKTERIALAMQMIDGLSFEEIKVCASHGSLRLQELKYKDLINIRNEFGVPPSTSHNSYNEEEISTFLGEVALCCSTLLNAADNLMSSVRSKKRQQFHRRLKDIASKFQTQIEIPLPTNNSKVKPEPGISTENDDTKITEDDHTGLVIDQSYCSVEKPNQPFLDHCYCTMDET